MDYRRIHILGGPGSGKTTLAARISAAEGISQTDLDDLFWDNSTDHYNLRRPPGERDQMLAKIVEQDRWIIEGVYHAWLEPSFSRADIIVVLSPSVWLRHCRIVRRFIRRRLGLEPCRKQETFRGLCSLLKWNHAFDGDNLRRARECLEPYEQKVRVFCAVDRAFAFCRGEKERRR